MSGARPVSLLLDSPIMSQFVLALFAVAALFSRVGPPESHHDPHPTSHAEEGASNEHRHGDADDRHESSDSPCHHHDGALPGCVCAPTALVASAVPQVGVAPDRFVRHSGVDRRPPRSIVLDELLHVPLA